MTENEVRCEYGDPLCPCTEGAACHYEWANGTPPMPHPKHRHQRPKGECVYCDREREAGNKHFPSHDASDRCESGKRPHCTCNVCW
jgi:hypothetical protein